jgi:hypothetical protein
MPDSFGEAIGVQDKQKRIYQSCRVRFSIFGVAVVVVCAQILVLSSILKCLFGSVHPLVRYRLQATA